MNSKPQNISMSELSGLTKDQAYRNFYLSPDDSLIQYYSSADSFIFNGFVIGLIESGEGTLKINGISYTVRANDIVFIGPNRLIEFEKDYKGRKRSAILVSTEFVIAMPSPVDVEVMKICNGNPVIHVSQELMVCLKNYYSSLKDNCTRPQSNHRIEIGKSLLYAMMLEICEFYKDNISESEEEKPLRHDRLYDEFFMLLSHYYRQERTVSFYADKMNLTPKYLSKAIKKVSGKSVLEWINEVVIIEAKLLLKTSDKTVLQISEELNFPNPSAFVQYFKLHTGQTPLKFRKAG